MSLLKIKDANGNWQDIPAIKGKDGKDGEVTLEQLKSITGELENLETENKSSLVNAINETNAIAKDKPIVIDDNHYFVNLNYTSSQKDEYNITQMQEALKHLLTKNVTIIVTYSSTSSYIYPKLYCLHTPLPDDITTYSGTLEWQSEQTVDGSDLYNDSYWILKLISNIRVTIENGIVTKVNGTNGANMSTQTAFKLPFLSTAVSRTYTPTADYHPATKKYVDDAVSELSTTNIPLYTIDLNDSFHADNSLVNLSSDERLELQNIIQDAYNKGYKTFLLYVFGTTSRISCLLSWSNAINLQNKPTVCSLFGYTAGSSYGRFNAGSLEAIGLNQLNFYPTWDGDIVTISRGNYIRSEEKYIPINNTNPYVPTDDYHPSTKKYVDDAIDTAITTVLEGEY